MRYLIRKPDTFITNLNDEINSILKRNFDTVFPEYALDKELKGISLPVDLQEFEDEYQVKVEVPGIKKEDLNIELNKNYVTISAEKNEEKVEKKKKSCKSEFRYGSYSRTVYFPSEIDINNSDAKIEHGVLKMVLPKIKKESEETRKLEVQ